MDIESLLSNFNPSSLGSSGLGGFGGCNSSIWLILLLFLFNNGGLNGSGCKKHHKDKCSNNTIFGLDQTSIFFIIILLCCCNNRPNFPVNPCQNNC